MNSPIDNLEQALWGACVTQRAAQNQETIDRWQTDEFSHLTERYIIQPMPPSLNVLVQSALVQWQQIEEKVCSNLGINREQFLSEFNKAREDFLGRGREWEKTIISMEPVVYGAVRNQDWVNMFSWVLPKADKEHSEEYEVIGRMVTALFYIELLSKNGHDFESEDLKKIEARWRLANQ
jgi:hypothetical protein